MLRGIRRPTALPLAEFQRVTGEKDFPNALKPQVRDDRRDYFCNNAVNYTLRGWHVRLEATWEFAAPAGKKDTERVSFRGGRTRVEVRQGGGGGAVSPGSLCVAERCRGSRGGADRVAELLAWRGGRGAGRAFPGFDSGSLPNQP